MLESPIGFDLAPDMPRGRAPFHSSAEGRDSRRRDVLAGPFTDTSPDSWGRKLIRRAHGEGATEFDYLVAANDKARQGALRFLNEEGGLFHPDQPPVHAWPISKGCARSRRVMSGIRTELKPKRVNLSARRVRLAVRARRPM